MMDKSNPWLLTKISQKKSRFKEGFKLLPNIILLGEIEVAELEKELNPHLKYLGKKKSTVVRGLKIIPVKQEKFFAIAYSPEVLIK